MAAPTPTARVTPTVEKPSDGFKTLITFATDPNIEFWEKTVTPPGIDGGDAIDNTTMHNIAWRSMGPRSLKTLTEATTTVTYNAVAYNSIGALINVPTTVTITFPDAATLCFYGYLRSFEPGDNSEGENPEATITVQPTNIDPNDFSEAAPVYTAGPGSAPMAPTQAGEPWFNPEQQGTSQESQILLTR